MIGAEIYNDYIELTFRVDIVDQNDVPIDIEEHDNLFSDEWKNREVDFYKDIDNWDDLLDNGGDVHITVMDPEENLNPIVEFSETSYTVKIKIHVEYAEHRVLDLDTMLDYLIPRNINFDGPRQVGDITYNYKVDVETIEIDFLPENAENINYIANLHLNANGNAILNQNNNQQPQQDGGRRRRKIKRCLKTQRRKHKKSKTLKRRKLKQTK